MSTSESYPLSLHDALPISHLAAASASVPVRTDHPRPPTAPGRPDGEEDAAGDDGLRLSPSRSDRRSRLAPQARDRKSTRLNSSHSQISYAVFCLKKKKKRI